MDYEHQVTLSGRSGSKPNEVIYGLPHGCHPESDLEFTAGSNVGPVTVKVWADGSITVDTETEWVDFDGISFIAAHI